MQNRIKVYSHIEEIPRQEWNQLALRSSPMLEWDYIHALEASDSVGPQKGYKAAHMVLQSESGPVGIAPLYERDRAFVEFGDGGLIEFLTDLTGLPFHKGIVGNIPYTPVPGYDFLHARDEDPNPLYRQLLEKVDAIVHERGLSTARFYFVDPMSPLHGILPAHGYVRLATPYLFWHNCGYETFNDYLMSFKSSRRTKIKREWRSISEMGVRFEMIPGADAPEALYREIYLLYRHTWYKHMSPGIRPFLNDTFFKMLAGPFRDRTCFVVSSLDGRRIALALFYRKADSLWGRYWGTFEEIPFLHFATCYYFPVAFGIDAGIKVFDPGFGGEHKVIRGFQTTQVSHFIKFYDERQRKIAYAVLDQMRDHLMPK